MFDYDNNYLIDLEEDYLADKLNKGLITEDYYNRQIDKLEELRD